MDIKISEFPHLTVGLSTNALVPVLQNDTNWTIGASMSAIPNSLVVRGSEGGAVFASQTGDGNYETAAVQAMAANIGTGSSGVSDNGIGVNGVSWHGTGVYGYSPSGRGSYGVSLTGLGLEGSSNSGTGLSVNTNSGTYSAVFQYGGDPQMCITGDGADLKWFNNGFSGTLKIDSLVQDMEWRLGSPGSILTEEPVTNNVYINGAVIINGMPEYATHNAADLHLSSGSLYTLVGNRTVYHIPNNGIS